MLKESLIQKKMKFLCVHTRLSGSTGFKSSFASINCALVRPGSDGTASLSSVRDTLESLSFAMAAAIYLLEMIQGGGIESSSESKRSPSSGVELVQ